MGRAVRIALAVAVGGVLIGAFLPWVRSGGATRNAFTTVRTARTLDLLGDSWATSALGLWFFVPMLVAVVLLALALGRDRSAAIVALVVAGVALAFAGIVALAGLGIEAGVVVTLLAGGLAVLAAVAVLVGTRGPR